MSYDDDNIFLLPDAAELLISEDQELGKIAEEILNELDRSNFLDSTAAIHSRTSP